MLSKVFADAQVIAQHLQMQEDEQVMHQTVSWEAALSVLSTMYKPGVVIQTNTNVLVMVRPWLHVLMTKKK